jgi:hypothetical protein
MVSTVAGPLGHRPILAPLGDAPWRSPWPLHAAP